MSVLDDLDEKELAELIATVRRIYKYRDMSDADVVIELLNDRIDHEPIARLCLVRKVLVNLVWMDYDMLQWVPKRMRSQELCMAAIRQFGGAIEFVPEHIIDKEMCAEAVSANYEAMHFVPERLMDRKMCLDAVRQCGGILWRVPEHLRDEEMCVAAGRQYDAGAFHAIKTVPKPVKATFCQTNRAQDLICDLDKTEWSELDATCKAMGFNDWHMTGNRGLARLLDDRNKTCILAAHCSATKVLLRLVSWDGSLLRHVPESLRIRDICLAATARSSWALSCVPENVKDKDICLNAVRQHGWALRWVPEHLMDRDVCLEAVSRHGIELRRVPDTMRDYEMCLAAARQDADAMEHVPEPLKAKVGKELGLDQPA